MVPEGRPGMWHMDDGSGWWMLWGMSMMVLFWGGLIALVVWGVQSVVRGEESPRTPLDVAQERLAKGDITVQEFEQIRLALGNR